MGKPGQQKKDSSDLKDSRDIDSTGADVSDRLRLLEMRMDNVAMKTDIAELKTGLVASLGDFKVGVTKEIGDFKTETCKEIGGAKTWYLERSIGISLILLGLVIGAIKAMLP